MKTNPILHGKYGNKKADMMFLAQIQKLQRHHIDLASCHIFFVIEFGDVSPGYFMTGLLPFESLILLIFDGMVSKILHK